MVIFFLGYNIFMVQKKLYDLGHGLKSNIYAKETTSKSRTIFRKGGHRPLSCALLGFSIGNISAYHPNKCFLFLGVSKVSVLPRPGVWPQFVSTMERQCNIDFKDGEEMILELSIELEV